MRIIDWFKRFLGIGQNFNSKDYVNEEWINPPVVNPELYEAVAASESSNSEIISASEPQKDEETHFWRDRAEKELPNAAYYIENFSEEQLRELVTANRAGHDISVFADPKQTPEQLRYIYKSAEAGEDVSYYIHNLSFDPAVLNNMKGELFEQEVKEAIHNSQAIACNGVPIFDGHGGILSTDDAIHLENMWEKSENYKHNHSSILNNSSKVPLEQQLQSASSRAVEAHSSDKSSVKKSTPER